MAIRENERHDALAGDTVIHRVVSAIAEAEGVDPVSLQPPLASVLDPDALELLLQRAEGWVQVEFDYGGWAVAARSDGSVEVSLPRR